MELQEIFNKLKEKEGFNCGQPQNENSISQLEKELKLTFPEEYKEFLKKFGFATWNGGQIYGASKNLEENVIHKNKLVREDIQPEEFIKLPDHAFLIEDYGDAFFMLFEKNSKRSGQVVLYLSEKPDWEEKSWPSFKIFLEEYCL
ncbi:MAG: hypothetical protein C5B43_03530 [Verrucomicrobia bacterium]|nr:MAG: hypothetical protein C5B43_03530 [Verrucomicrobiota bacterium]